jgi:prephenate dehydratase
MAVTIAHLGPTGTNAEAAALAFAQWLDRHHQQTAILCPYASIAQTLTALAQEQVTLAIVPVENSTEGSVGTTLDTIWQLGGLYIQQELLLPITHVLIFHGSSLADIKTVFSHPQALAQCQQWLERSLPDVQLIPTNSTTEAILDIQNDPKAAAIASPRAAQLYKAPVIVTDIQDYPDNCTRFWVMGRRPIVDGSWLSLGFSVPANVPGALVKPLEVFARRNINLRRIESRPTKRSLGEYIFFLDLESGVDRATLQEALAELANHTKLVKNFGSYPIIAITPP